MGNRASAVLRANRRRLPDVERMVGVEDGEDGVREGALEITHVGLWMR